MTASDAIVERVRELVEDADWSDLTERLAAFTRAYLHNVAGHSHPRQKIVHAYVVQAVSETVCRGANYGRWQQWETLFQLLCIVVARLINEYEEAFRTIVRNTNWEEMISRLIAHTVRRHGARTSRHGRTAEDYVSGAIVAMLAHERYFPFDRVTLFVFLCGTIRSLYTHEAEKMAAEGAHLTIVKNAFEDVAPTEWSEESLVAPTIADDRLALVRARDFLYRIGDHDLRRYAELRALGVHRTAAEYAHALSVTEQKVRNWDRQLKRLRDRWDAR
jgi:hypothetical protein